ncbi:MAG TPA: dihydroorotate dehydrogenase electron transfer subunit [Solirubrobacteraceae bacterium]|nr:dihydroorotate dehydrogenase electron transfer subunit [Solirubrobacteraceae bacterium]
MRPIAPLGRRRVVVTSCDDVGAYRVVDAADPDGPVPAAGQFYMLAAVHCWGATENERPFLPRAFSFLRADAGALRFMFEDVGPGTRRLAELTAGDELWVTGPLGEGFRAPNPSPPARRPLLAGGGIGVPPLAAWATELGTRPRALLGFRDREHAAGAAVMSDAEVTVATEDGSVGHHGLVTELLAAELARDPHAIVYSCGPPRMLEAVRALCMEHDVPAQLALEAGMACGFGACYGCVVPVRDGGYVRVCVDGPVLDADRLEPLAEDAH